MHRLTVAGLWALTSINMDESTFSLVPEVTAQCSKVVNGKHLTDQRAESRNNRNPSIQPWRFFQVYHEYTGHGIHVDYRQTSGSKLHLFSVWESRWGCSWNVCEQRKFKLEVMKLIIHLPYCHSNCHKCCFQFPLVHIQLECLFSFPTFCQTSVFHLPELKQMQNLAFTNGRWFQEERGVGVNRHDSPHLSIPASLHPTSLGCFIPFSHKRIIQN